MSVAISSTWEAVKGGAEAERVRELNAKEEAVSAREAEARRVEVRIAADMAKLKSAVGVGDERVHLSFKGSAGLSLAPGRVWFKK